MKTRFSMLMIAIIIFALSGCSNGTATTSYISNVPKPAVGDTIATVSIEGYGDIKILLLPEVAPKAVESFIYHAENKIFDGVMIYRLTEYSFSTGSYSKEMYESREVATNYQFEEFLVDEFSPEAKHFTGAVSLHTNGANRSHTEFFFVNTDPIDKVFMDDMLAKDQFRMPYLEGDYETYLNVGGLPYLDGENIVFGYVYEGLDVVEAVHLNTEHQGLQSMPTNNAKITTITISTYSR